jgi:hypothetical protein
MKLDRSTVTTDTHDALQEQLVIYHLCPRISAWNNNNINSILHPNISSSVIGRKKQKELIESGMDYSLILSPSKLSMALQVELKFMIPQERWNHLSVIYKRNILDASTAQEKLVNIQKQVAREANLVYLIEEWYDEMCGSKDAISRSIFLKIFMKIYDILVPPNILTPMEKAMAVQADFRHYCKKDLNLGYISFSKLILHLCDNWINMDPQNNNQLTTEVTKESISHLSEKYNEFLSQLFAKVFDKQNRPNIIVHRQQLSSMPLQLNKNGSDTVINLAATSSVHRAAERRRLITQASLPNLIALSRTKTL